MVYDQRETPYYKALLEYTRSDVLTFHVPGHQKGRGAHPLMFELLGEKALVADTTQVLGLDDMHQPHGPAKFAQELAAIAYGADATFFLINGSSSGNHIMILSVCRPGDKVILPRNSHRSAIGALILSGVKPVYVMPEFDMEMRVDHTVTPEKFEKAISENPDAKALFVLSPTYYGATADLKTIVEVGHRNDMVVIVDEAWGPHLHFHPELPDSAMDAGADLCVNSTHKLIAGMSQGSMIHVQGHRVDYGHLHSVLRLFLSTSPSCLIVSSLDVARMQMFFHGRDLLDKALKNADWARERINNIPGLHTWGEEIIGRPGVAGFDRTRLVISSREAGFTGYQMERFLRYDHNIQIEMSDLFNVLALVTIAHTREDMEKLVRALECVVKDHRGEGDLPRLREEHRTGQTGIQLPDWPPQVMTPRDAFFSDYRTIPFPHAAGHISAELITPYPPGIPLVCPGERITSEIINYALLELAAGVRIQGPVDDTLGTIKVVNE
ncbi:MAG: aminotransferase class I/II-fold pyridoxal phosphate-dependent enzyme [Candidatus Eremiobacteraeota bacterium]|nr:aminotransferase class I/II-fold pyridoxal phosphate-dependent enzyme [Candidatus Eremiobacteraeota bacterium]